MKTPARVSISDSVVVVVDVQDKLLPKIHQVAELLNSVAFVLDVAKVLEVPVVATEQYPKGLGATTPEIAKRLPPDLPSKTAFSCCGAAGFLHELRRLNRTNVILVGIETHVCVSQTALDLIEAGFQIFLPVDALSSRRPLDKDAALLRLQQAGAVVTSAEALAFEWLGDATHPRFKDVSRLVIARN